MEGFIYAVCRQQNAFRFLVREKKGRKINPLLNDIILEVTKLKVFADDKLNFARLMICLLDRVENTVGKGENAGYQHFLLFLQCFPKPSSLGLLKVGIMW